MVAAKNVKSWLENVCFVCCLFSFLLTVENSVSLHNQLISSARSALPFVFNFIQLKRGQLIFISYGKWLFKSFHPALYSVLSVKVVY